MRIVLFGTAGHSSLLPLQELLREHDVVGAVLPQGRRGLRARVGSLLRRVRGIAAQPTEALLEARRIPLFRSRRTDLAALAPVLAALAPDVVCVAGFPYILPPAVLDVAGRATLNFHPALLPRHRGPLPLFWTYHADDRQSGATIHLVDPGADTGAILAQSSFELLRGQSVTELAERLRLLGAKLLRETLASLDHALANARTQDDTLATVAPIVRPGTSMVDFARWDSERVWHFLHGLYPFFIEPLAGGVTYRGVDDYDLHPGDAVTGSVSDAGRHWLLHCRDGVVRLRK
jgi:methionyl-tRNA formyltransferase